MANFIVLSGLVLPVTTTIIFISTVLLTPIANANNATHIQTVYQSIGEFGEVKYSQFPPPVGTKAITLQFRADGQQSHSGQRAADYNTYPSTNFSAITSNNSSPYSTSQTTTAPSSTVTASTQISTAADTSDTLAHSSTAQAQSQVQMVAKDTAHQKQCQILQLNLENLSANSQVYEIDANGLRTYLTATDVELKRDNTKLLLAQYCRSP